MSRSAAITLGALEADEDGDGAASFPTSLEGRPSDVSEQAQSVSLAGEQGASTRALGQQQHWLNLLIQVSKN